MVVDWYDDISGHRIGERHRATTSRWRAHFPRASAHMFASTRRGAVRAIATVWVSPSPRHASPRSWSSVDRPTCYASSLGMSTSATPNLNAMVQGLPLVIAHTEASGRGVYAARRIPAGEVVHKAQPLVAHPTLENLDKVCYHCLARLPTDDPMSQEGWVPTHGGGDGGGSAGYFCGKKCAQAAWESYHAVETAAGNAVAPLVRHCVQHGLKFPLVAARLAAAVVSGAVSANVADPLCFVNFPDGIAPGDWLEEHAMIRVAMARGMVFNRAKGGGLGADPGAAARLAGVTPEWYVGVTSRLHLNAFRVEIPAIVGDDHSHAHSHASGECGHDHSGDGKGECGHDHGGAASGGKGECGHDHGEAASGGGGDFKAAMEAALFASEAGVGTGSALYLMPSMLNHSCDPNVDAVWIDGDATLTLRTRRDIQEGEQLTITYIDADSPASARRQRLEHAYGFVCGCERCVEEAKGDISNS